MIPIAKKDPERLSFSIRNGIVSRGATASFHSIPSPVDQHSPMIELVPPDLPAFDPYPTYQNSSDDVISALHLEEQAASQSSTDDFSLDTRFNEYDSSDNLDISIKLDIRRTSVMPKEEPNFEICVTPPRKMMYCGGEEFSDSPIRTSRTSRNVRVRRVTRSQTRARRRLECGFTSPVKLSFESGNNCQSYVVEHFKRLSPVRREPPTRSSRRYVQVGCKRVKLYVRNNVENLVGGIIGNEVVPQFTFDPGHYGKYPYIRSTTKLETNSFKISGGRVERLVSWKHKPKPQAPANELDENNPTHDFSCSTVHDTRNSRKLKREAGKRQMPQRFQYYLELLMNDLKIPLEIATRSADILYDIQRHPEGWKLPLSDLKLMAACCMYFSCQRRGESREIRTIATSCSLDISQVDDCCAKIGKLLNYYHSQIPPPPPTTSAMHPHPPVIPRTTASMSRTTVIPRTTMTSSTSAIASVVPSGRTVASRRHLLLSPIEVRLSKLDSKLHKTNNLHIVPPPPPPPLER